MNRIVHVTDSFPPSAPWQHLFPLRDLAGGSRLCRGPFLPDFQDAIRTLRVISQKLCQDRGRNLEASQLHLAGNGELYDDFADLNVFQRAVFALL